MKKQHSITLTILSTFVLACSQPDVNHEKKMVDTTNAETNMDRSSRLLKPYEETADGYTFKFGYFKYDEEKYGFSNPGFLKVYKDNKLIYSDSFKGEGPLSIKSLGYHDLDGKKLVFRFNYGTEGCDYAYNSKYYFADNAQCRFLKECYSVTGGDHYSSRFYEHIFPNDSAGQTNAILIVEGHIFHEKDQPDRFDTTFIKFGNNKFTITKPTDNLGKVQ